MKNMKRSVALLVAIALLIGCAAGGTMAWLMMKTDPVVNTFTTANVEIILTETDTDSDENEFVNSYKLIPGKIYTKDPVITVVEGSEDCYLFVKFEETDNQDDYLTYTSTLTTGNGWTQGDGDDIPEDVWYRTVAGDDNTRSWNLLEDDTIKVNESVTKDNMADAATARLTYTAYAVQQAGMANAAEAWAQAQTLGD